MFYELRRYQIQPNRRDEWVRYMDEVILPYQSSKGMVITASFVDEEDPDAYIWLRRFENEEERVRLYAETYQDDRWINEIGVVAGEMLVSAQVTRLVPTPNTAVL